MTNEDYTYEGHIVLVSGKIELGQQPLEFCVA